MLRTSLFCAQSCLIGLLVGCSDPDESADRDESMEETGAGAADGGSTAGK